MEAFRHWKALYNLALLMTYTTFLILAYRLYEMPQFTTRDAELLKHVVAVFGVGLQIWVNLRVFRVIGPLAWFHGEFFIDTLPPQSATGRGYFRQPLLYQFSIWSAVLVCQRWEMLGVSIYSQVSHYLFLILVKNRAVQTTRGVPTGHRRSMSIESETSLVDLSDDESEVIEKIKRVVKGFEGLVKPHMQNMVEKTRRGVVKIANSSLEESLALTDIPTILYGLQCVREVGFGERMEVLFEGCRETMKVKDWMGVYEVGANFDSKITTTTCSSRWSYLAGPVFEPSNPDAQLFTRKGRDVYLGRSFVTLSKSSIPGLRVVRGSVLFEEDMIPWKSGVYEVRYHHDGKHNVVTRSQPFEVIMPDAKEVLEVRDIIDQLHQLVSRCLDLHPGAVLTHDEGLLAKVALSPRLAQKGVSLDRYRKQVSLRIVYVIRSLYSVDFSWKAVDNLYSLQNLAERVRRLLTVGV